MSYIVVRLTRPIFQAILKSVLPIKGEINLRRVNQCVSKGFSVFILFTGHMMAEEARNSVNMSNKNSVTGHIHL